MFGLLHNSDILISSFVVRCDTIGPYASVNVESKRLLVAGSVYHTASEYNKQVPLKQINV